MAELLNGLNLLFLAIGLCLGYWKCRHDVKVGTPSASHNSVKDAILLADEYHTTTRSYSKEEVAICGFKRWLRAKQHP